MSVWAQPHLDFFLGTELLDSIFRTEFTTGSLYAVFIQLITELCS